MSSPAQVAKLQTAAGDEDSKKSMHRGLPIIMCPMCGEHLRLTTIMPEDNHRQRMTFVCEYGFDYRQSSAVASERDL